MNSPENDNEKTQPATNKSKSPAQETTANTNINSTDIDDETAVKLRGDAIGDTLYSESFVAKTLLNFTDMKWSKSLEDDLCFLWDMTVEKDVCSYLFSLSYPSLACTAVMEHLHENRFVEIVVGILANIFCASCEKSITIEEVVTVLELLDVDDPLILVQVMRFVKAVVYVTEDMHYITKDILDKIHFILVNSLNCELLSITLDTLSHILSDGKLGVALLNGDLLAGSLGAYRTICGNYEYSLDSSDLQNSLSFLLSIVTSFAYYLNIAEDDELSKTVHKSDAELTEEIKQMFKYYEKDDNLIPVTDNFKLYIEYLSYFLPILNLAFDGELFGSYLKILSVLYDCHDLEVNVYSELFCYYISKGTEEQIITEFKSSLKKHEAANVLTKLRDCLEKDNFKCARVLESFVGDEETDTEIPD